MYGELYGCWQLTHLKQKSCIAMICHAMLRYVILCYMLFFIMLTCVMQCYVMLCFAIICYNSLCNVMLCYAKQNCETEGSSGPLLTNPPHQSNILQFFDINAIKDAHLRTHTEWCLMPLSCLRYGEQTHMVCFMIRSNGMAV